MLIKKIVSGGQTGVDLAALDVAMELGIPCGGWVPAGRVNEDGVIPSRYPNLNEAGSVMPEMRTELNVMDADVILILARGPLEGGTLYTQMMADKYDKPCIQMSLSDMSPQEIAEDIKDWLALYESVGTLNVAGPRASEDPRIYRAAKEVLMLLFKGDEPDVLH